MLVQPGRWAGALLIGNSVPVATNKEVYWGLMVGFTIFILTLYTTFIYQKRGRDDLRDFVKKLLKIRNLEVLPQSARGFPGYPN